MMMRARDYGRREGVYEPSVRGVSSDAERVDRSIETALHHYRETITSRRGTIEEEFAQLAAKWREDTEYQSSITQIAMHPAYQRIIGMGPEAVPLLLRDLEETQAHWFWALRAITGEDPVPVVDRGYIDRMISAWVRWGYQKRVL